MATLGARVSTYEFGGDNSVHSKGNSVSAVTPSDKITDLYLVWSPSHFHSWIKIVGSYTLDQHCFQLQMTELPTQSGLKQNLNLLQYVTEKTRRYST
jgi:hypothetical protein